MEPPATQALRVDEIASLRVALVGFGEVGGIFGAALVRAGVSEVAAFDVLIEDASWAVVARARAAHDGVALVSTTSEAVATSDLVISAVTAAATPTAADQIADACRAGTFVLDVNSASPKTKAACALAVERAGGRYVEAAVMSSVPPHGIRVPMLLGGPHASALRPALASLGFAATVGSTEYGVVSAIKLCRSVVVKGMEALVIESLLAARRYGVEREVLASLAETFPGLDWERQVTWFWRRVVQHGRRRAEEMREAAVTVSDAGIAPRMANATADVQGWVAALQAEDAFAGAGPDAGWRELADRVQRTTDRSPPRRSRDLEENFCQGNAFMNSEELKSAVNARNWWHRIDLGNGIVTPGLDDSPKKLAALGMPADLSGKTVLDIGAWDGFFSFEAERRGGIVTASDHYCWSGQGMISKEGFDIAKQARGSKVTELRVTVEDLPKSGLEPFDLVLFLGVLYHAPDPLGYLRIVRSLTRGFAIIETHVDLLDVPVPACAYYPGAMLNNDPSNFFGPNELAVHGMCKDAGFTRVVTLPEIYMPGRRVFHAYA